ncbi:MAG: heparinase II/III family protein, partial [Candidatus Latescibacterota bacterium]
MNKPQASATGKKKCFSSVFCIFVFGILIISQTAPGIAQLPSGPVKAPSELKSILRSDHPRIFFNAESFPAIKARALNEEKELFTAMNKRVDLLDAEKAKVNDYGTQSAEAAFVFLVTGNDAYLAKTKKLLKKSIDYYWDCYNRQTPVNWYGYTQSNAWAAYDWIFNYLTNEERRELAMPFLDEVEKIQPTTSRHYFYPQENWSGPTTGFYGNPSILWYAGLALFGEGIDDARAETFLAEGYRMNMALLAHRSKCAGDDGGSASACMNYVMAAYPWAEYNFFHTFRSATGKNIALDWPYSSFLSGYLYWNMLPGRREFGVGDAPHTTNLISLSDMRTHLFQIINFYGESSPKCAAFSKWMIGQVPGGNYGSFPYLPFLLTERRDDVQAIGPETVMPHARHYENMGQIFMRSGAGTDDTYALFMSGGIVGQHKHWDNNQFVIYKKGFLALDTGSRPAPGTHTQGYFPRTVAHNCILINMPGEVLPVFVDKGAGGGQRWGAPAPGEQEAVIPNDGGQNELLGSKVTAFETNDNYSYAAGDATGSYSREKCSLVLRQFVFLHPDYFVIFDRVVSTSPEYKKTWLLHTATEPLIEKSIF